MPLRCYPAAALLLLGAMACAKDDPAPPAAPSVVGSGMPTFERRPLAIAEEDLPEGRYMFFDVLTDGSIIYQASPAESPLLRHTDSTGKRIAALGSRGEGPGEFRMLVGLTAHGDTLQLHEAGRSSLIELNLKGKLIRERRLTHFDLTLAWHPDSVDHWQPLPVMGGMARKVIRSRIGEAAGRVVIDSSHPTVGQLLKLRADPAEPPRSFHYFASGDRYWVADGWGYRVATLMADGQVLHDFVHDIPPNQRGPRGIIWERTRILKTPRFTRGPNGERIPLTDERGRLDTLERERIPHFTRNPLHVDEFGRLWVVGVSRDSTSVDLFADTTFVGRVMLPCYASGVGLRVAFGRGGWMVLECEVEGGDWPTELQLYRIIERPTP